MSRSPGNEIASRGFGRRIGFGKAPALIVVDLICAFTDPDQPLGSDLATEIAATNRLLDAFHAVCLPVFVSTMGYEKEAHADAGVWAIKQGGLESLKAGTANARPDPRLRLHPSDRVFSKNYASCFFGTDLISRLVSSRTDTVVVAGCTTSGCVRATAVDAVQYGFRPMVVREAVGDRWPDAHTQAIFDLDAKYADVVDIDEVLKAIRLPNR